MENLDYLVHFKIQQQTEDRLTKAGLLGDFWPGKDFPMNIFRPLSPLDVLIIGSDPQYQFDTNNPLQGMKALSLLEPLYDELTTGLSEFATGMGTGVAVLDIGTDHPDFPFDATRYNSLQFPYAVSYLMDLGMRINYNPDALAFLGITGDPDASRVMREISKRAVYENLRHINVAEEDEPDSLSLNKLLRVLEGDIDPEELLIYPFLKPVQKSMASYVYRTAYNLSTQNLEKPENIALGAQVAKSANAKTGEIIDNLPRTPEQRTASLHNLFLKLTGSRVIPKAELIYALIAFRGLGMDPNFPPEDYGALVEEITQTHEEIHLLARSIGRPLVYNGSIVNTVKFGFLIGTGRLEFNGK